MPVSENRRRYSNVQGDAAANRFVRACEAMSYVCEKTDKMTDIYKHIDYYITRFGREKTIGVDVKGCNHPECIWVEFQNVSGKKGWLLGEADFIAFDMPEEGGFCIVLRQELLEYCEKNIVKEFTTKQNAYKKLYQRSGREDIISKLYLTDIKTIPSYKLLRYSDSQ